MSLTEKHQDLGMRDNGDDEELSGGGGKILGALRQL